jgi:hypothetical protein
LDGYDWILLFYGSILRQFRRPGEKSHPATKLGTASQGYGWVYSFSRTSPPPAKLGSPAAVLMLQKLHYHPDEQVSSE